MAKRMTMTMSIERPLRTWPSRRRTRGAAAWIAAALVLASTATARATPVDPALIAAAERRPGSVPTAPAALVELGRRIFTTETFAGNGRTCATCHRPDDNFTIDPA